MILIGVVCKYSYTSPITMNFFFHFKLVGVYFTDIFFWGVWEDARMTYISHIICPVIDVDDIEEVWTVDGPQ